MININKIIKMVKSGNIFYQAFNLRKKESQLGQYVKPKNIRPVPSDIPVNIDVQNKENLPQVASPPASTPQETEPQAVTPQAPSFQVSAPQDISSNVPEEINSIMNRWVRENIKEMKDVSEHKADKDIIGPDNMLSILIKRDEESGNFQNLRGILNEKIQGESRSRNIPIDENLSKAFINTMLEKSEKIWGAYDERIKEIDDEGLEEQTRQVSENLYGKDDLSSVAVSELDVLLNSKIMEAVNMKYEGKIDLKVGNFLKDLGLSIFNEDPVQLLTDGITFAFGEPGLTKVKQEEGRDQRLNFFLKNPSYLEPFLIDNLHAVFANDFADAEGNENKQLGVLSKFNNDNGGILYERLKDSIENMEPAIMRWLKRGLLAVMKKHNNTITDQDEEEGRRNSVVDKSDAVNTGDIGLGLEGLTEKEKLQRQQTTSKQAQDISFITKELFREDIDSMQKLNESTSQAMMENYIRDFKIGEKTLPANVKDSIIGSYSKAEKLNTCFKYVLEQFEKLFSASATPLTEDMSKMVYQNDRGKNILPIEILKNFRSIGKGEEERENYKAQVKEYKEKIKSGKIKSSFNPKWREMISYKVILDAFADLGEIKSKIFDLQKAGHSDASDIIGNQFRNKRDMYLLKKLSNVIEPQIDPTTGKQIGGDSQQAVSMKINNFVNMTLQQGKRVTRKEKETDLKKPFEAYAKRLELEKEMKNLDKIASPKMREKREKEIKKVYEDIGKNYLADLGAAYMPILPYIKKHIEEFPIEVRKSFVDIFDSRSTQIKNFLSPWAQTANVYDEDRETNTELYYKVRGEEIPEHVQAMIQIKKEKEQQDRGLVAEEMKTYAIPSTPPKEVGWREYVLYKYHKLDMYSRKIPLIIENINKAKNAIADKKIWANNDAFKRIRNLKDKKGGKGWINLLKSIKDENVRNQFESHINRWKGMSLLPLDYYIYLGQGKTTKSTIENNQKMVAEKEKERSEIMQRMDEIEVEMDYIFEKHGREKPDFSALRLVAEYYKTAQVRLLKLYKMKQQSYKFASMNTDVIDKAIRKEKSDFYKLFDSLLR